MNVTPRWFACALVVLAACGDNLHVAADAPVDAAMPATRIVITPDPSTAGRAIPDDFLGASYETSTLLPDASGAHYFRASNTALLQMFATLGLESLRLGGNEAESGPLPSDADITDALAFVSAAHVDLLYTLRMATYDPTGQAATAQFILASGTPGLRCFSLGNEGIGIASYDAYKADAQAYIAAIGDPRARYCAPDMFGADWPSRFAHDFAATGQVSAADMHAYFGGNGQQIDAPHARDAMLSPSLLDAYTSTQEAIAQGVAGTGVPFRLSETNSYYNGGCPGASDTFASALWGLDYLHWWAAHDADGVNFHTGDHVSGATTTYSLFKTSPGGYAVHPLGYAVKAFALGGRGRIVPVTIDNPPGVNLTAYAVLAPSGELDVTIINKTHDAGAQDAQVAIATAASHADAWLLADAGGVAATTGVTLGGAPIGDDGTWTGATTPVPIAGGEAQLDLAPASAAVVRLSP